MCVQASKAICVGEFISVEHGRPLKGPCIKAKNRCKRQRQTYNYSFRVQTSSELSMSRKAFVTFRKSMRFLLPTVVMVIVIFLAHLHLKKQEQYIYLLMPMMLDMIRLAVKFMLVMEKVALQL